MTPWRGAQEAVVRNDSALAEAQALSVQLRNERDALAVEVESCRHAIQGLQARLAEVQRQCMEKDEVSGRGCPCGRRGGNKCVEQGPRLAADAVRRVRLLPPHCSRVHAQMLNAKASAAEAMELQLRDMPTAPQQPDAELASLRRQLEQSQGRCCTQPQAPARLMRRCRPRRLACACEAWVPPRAGAADAARKELELERAQAEKQRAKLANDAKAQHRIAEVLRPLSLPPLSCSSFLLEVLRALTVPKLGRRPSGLTVEGMRVRDRRRRTRVTQPSKTKTALCRSLPASKSKRCLGKPRRRRRWVLVSPSPSRASACLLRLATRSLSMSGSCLLQRARRQVWPHLRCACFAWVPSCRGHVNRIRRASSTLKTSSSG